MWQRAAMVLADLSLASAQIFCSFSFLAEIAQSEEAEARCWWLAVLFFFSIWRAELKGLAEALSLQVGEGRAAATHGRADAAASHRCSPQSATAAAAFVVFFVVVDTLASTFSPFAPTHLFRIASSPRILHLPSRSRLVRIYQHRVLFVTVGLAVHPWHP